VATPPGEGLVLLEPRIEPGSCSRSGAECRLFRPRARGERPIDVDEPASVYRFQRAAGAPPDWEEPRPILGERSRIDLPCRPRTRRTGSVVHRSRPPTCSTRSGADVQVELRPGGYLGPRAGERRSVLATALERADGGPMLSARIDATTVVRTVAEGVAVEPGLVLVRSPRPVRLRLLRAACRWPSSRRRSARRTRRWNLSDERAILARPRGRLPRRGRRGGSWVDGRVSGRRSSRGGRSRFPSNRRASMDRQEALSGAWSREGRGCIGTPAPLARLEEAPALLAAADGGGACERVGDLATGTATLVVTLRGRRLRGPLGHRLRPSCGAPGVWQAYEVPHGGIGSPIAAPAPATYDVGVYSEIGVAEFSLVRRAWPSARCVLDVPADATVRRPIHMRAAPGPSSICHPEFWSRCGHALRRVLPGRAMRRRPPLTARFDRRRTRRRVSRTTGLWHATAGLEVPLGSGGPLEIR
jgi:hypothetical protein